MPRPKGKIVRKRPVRLPITMLQNPIRIALARPGDVVEIAGRVIKPKRGKGGR
jgi:acetamidase/formamidase